jgi:hypothetical protein
MVQSLLLDVIVYRAFVVGEPLNPAYLTELQRLSEMIFGEIPALTALIETASGDASVSSASSISVIYAYAAAISAQSVRSDPALRFYRDMMMTGRIATSFARGALAPAFVSEVATGWQYVLDHQRFRLRSPAGHVPAIESALEDMKSPTLAKTAALLLAAGPAVGHRYGDGWEELLTRIALSQSAARSND